MNNPVTHRGALPPGTRVQDFEFERVLGHGGFGITYRGRNTVLQKTVAIKEYMPAGTAIRDADQSVFPKAREDEQDYAWGLQRFLDEARMLARFDHPGIVRVQQFFEAHGTAYIAMEFLDGRTLAAVYEERREWDEGELRALLSPVLNALEEVHEADFLHRDIKPGNIMFRNDQTPVLIDFGAARAAIARRSQNMTAIVTPGFSPIEQYSTSAEAQQGPWTDIYALGALLYRGMANRVPSDATARTMDDDYVPVRAFTARRYSKPLTDAVDWALRMRWSERPQSIAEWRQVLDQGEAPPFRPARPAPATHPAAAGGTQSAMKSSGKGRWAAVALGLAAALIAGSVAYWWDDFMRPGAGDRSVVGSPPADPDPARSLQRRIAELEALIGQGDLGAAREQLEEIRRTGELDDATYGELSAAIRDADAAERLSRLFRECQEQATAQQLAEALSCYREVLTLRPDHADGVAEVRRLEPLVAWSEANTANSVDGYFAFEERFPASPFAELARRRLNDAEGTYWQQMQASGTSAAYRRYLEIYPEGTFAALARERLSQGD